MKFAALSALLIAACLVGCGEKDEFKPVKEEADKVTGADAVIENFEANGFKTDQSIWKLIARKAYIFQKEGRTVISDVKIDYYSGGKVSTKVTGKEAVLDNKEQLLTISREVVVVSENGRKLETDDLTWSEKTRVLYTDAHVKITMPEGDQIEGEGLRADQKLEKLVLNRGKGVHPN